MIQLLLSNKILSSELSVCLSTVADHWDIIRIESISAKIKLRLYNLNIYDADCPCLNWIASVYFYKSGATA